MTYKPDLMSSSLIITPTTADVQRLRSARADSHAWRTAAAYLLFALLALAIVALHVDHFRGRPYRQDEAWIVHGALEKFGAQDVTQWTSTNIHPPLWIMVANAWVDLFGQNELITRFLSALFTLVSLALLYRLAADLAGNKNRTIPLAAVFLVGTSGFFQFYGQEFRPYPALIMCALGTTWAFMRWLRHPDFRRALLFVGFGIAMLYVHFFAVYVLAALAIFFVLFVRWNPSLYLRALGLFAAVGASYLGWLLPFLYAVFVTNPGGIGYALKSNRDTLALLWRYMSLQPYDVAEFLLITSALILLRRKDFSLPSFQRRFRFDPIWRKAYPLVIGVAIFLVAFAVNAKLASLTQRELVVLMPFAALFVAFGFAALPRAAQVAVVVLLLPSALGFINYESPGPQADVAAYIAPSYQAGSPIILNVPYIPRHVAVLYYVQNRVTPTPIANNLMWQVIQPGQAYIDFLPYKPVHQMGDVSVGTLNALRSFLASVNQDQVWYIETAGGNFYSAAIRSVLAERYAVIDQHSWKGEYSVFQYRRQSTPP